MHSFEPFERRASVGYDIPRHLLNRVFNVNLNTILHCMSAFTSSLASRSGSQYLLNKQLRRFLQPLVGHQGHHHHLYKHTSPIHLNIRRLHLVSLLPFKKTYSDSVTRHLVHGLPSVKLRRYSSTTMPTEDRDILSEE